MLLVGFLRLSFLALLWLLILILILLRCHFHLSMVLVFVGFGGCHCPLVCQWVLGLHHRLPHP